MGSRRRCGGSITGWTNGTTSEVNCSNVGCDRGLWSWWLVSIVSMEATSIFGQMRTFCLSEAPESLEPLMGVRLRRCSDQSSTSLCVSTRLMLYEIGRNLHGLLS